MNFLNEEGLQQYHELIKKYSEVWDYIYDGNGSYGDTYTLQQWINGKTGRLLIKNWKFNCYDYQAITISSNVTYIKFESCSFELDPCDTLNFNGHKNCTIEGLSFIHPQVVSTSGPSVGPISTINNFFGAINCTASTFTNIQIVKNCKALTIKDCSSVDGIGPQYSNIAGDARLMPTLFENVKYPLPMLSTIYSLDIPKGQTETNAIELNEYGLYFINGDNITVSYIDGNGTEKSFTSNIHIIIRTKAHSVNDFNAATDRIFHAYLSYTLTSTDLEITSGITVKNGSSQYGCRVHKMPMTAI